MGPGSDQDWVSCAHVAGFTMGQSDGCFMHRTHADAREKVRLRNIARAEDTVFNLTRAGGEDVRVAADTAAPHDVDG
jgi:hypothetical protein